MYRVPKQAEKGEPSVLRKKENIASNKKKLSVPLPYIHIGRRKRCLFMQLPDSFCAQPEDLSEKWGVFKRVKFE